MRVLSGGNLSSGGQNELIVVSNCLLSDGDYNLRTRPTVQSKFQTTTFKCSHRDSNLRSLDSKPTRSTTHPPDTQFQLLDECNFKHLFLQFSKISYHYKYTLRICMKNKRGKCVPNYCKWHHDSGRKIQNKEIVLASCRRRNAGFT